MEHASSVSGILEESPFVREEMQYLTPRYLFEAWGRQVYGDSVETLTDEQRRAVDREWQSIQRMLVETHPIAQLVSAIVEAAGAGKRGTALHASDTPERRRETFRDETIANRCADLFEELTARCGIPRGFVQRSYAGLKLERRLNYLP